MWTTWQNIEIAKSKKGAFQDFGIYQIRATNRNSNVIPIQRLNGVGVLGILYIGRSGFRNQNTARTVARRLSEFVMEGHSGGITYGLAYAVLNKNPDFSGHSLEVQAKFLQDADIEKSEAMALREYFLKFAELPPFNSAFPNKKSFK